MVTAMNFGFHNTNTTLDVRLEIFTAMKIHVAVLWIMTTGRDVVGYNAASIFISP
jgi:hypothetical protein